MKTKIRYQYVTGEVVYVEVEGELAEQIAEIDRIGNNNDRRERERCNASIEFLSEQKDTELADIRINIEADLIRHEERKRLYQAIKTLNEEQRQIIIKSYFDREGLKEIATVMGISFQAVHERLKVILKKLLRNLAEQP